MDKKSFLFVFLVTISFFFINNYLFPSKPFKEQVQEETTHFFEALSGKRIKDLPLVPLSFDQAGDQFAIYALEFDDSFLTLTAENDLPATLYYKERPLQHISASKKGTPLLYTASSSPSLPVANIEGHKELELYQISNLHQEAGVKIISSILGALKTNNDADSAVEKNAITLVRSPQGWLPVGYRSEDGLEHTAFEHLSAQDLVEYVTYPVPPPASREASFYVLENDYIQLVFSTEGGALAEINLPLRSNTNHKTIVRTIRFDEEIAEQSTSNDYFPNYAYHVIDANGSDVKHDPVKGGYMPLLRRNLQDSKGNTTAVIPSRYYALNLISGDAQENSSPIYKVKRFEKGLIEFEVSTPYRKITKTFSLHPNLPYLMDVSVKVEGDSKDLWLTSGMLEVELLSASYSPFLQYYGRKGKSLKTVKLSLPKKEPTSYVAGDIHWASSSNGFFGTILNPLNAVDGIKSAVIPGKVAPTRLSLVDTEYNLYPADNYPAYELLTPYDGSSSTYRYFAGPYEKDVLVTVDKTISNGDKAKNPQFLLVLASHGWFAFISEPFSKLLFLVLQFFHFITHSWGISIILLTLLLRVLLYPLNSWSFKSTMKMQQISPKLAALQEKYKKDPKRLQTETAMLYKNEGVNPFSGCLPMLIQLPFLIGMFDLLKSSFQLRGASFIPGWITNLTAPDVLFSWGYPLPFLGADFHLLPFILGGLMYAQQKLNNLLQASKGPLTEQQEQMKNMGTIMTVVFTVLFYNMPSGLNLYWIFSTIFGMAQQWFTMKHLQGSQPLVKR